MLPQDSDNSARGGGLNRRKRVEVLVLIHIMQEQTHGAFRTNRARQSAKAD